MNNSSFVWWKSTKHVGQSLKQYFSKTDNMTESLKHLVLVISIRLNHTISYTNMNPIKGRGYLKIHSYIFTYKFNCMSCPNYSASLIQAQYVLKFDLCSIRAAIFFFPFLLFLCISYFNMMIKQMVPSHGKWLL